MALPQEFLDKLSSASVDELNEIKQLLERRRDGRLPGKDVLKIQEKIDIIDVEIASR